MVERNQFGEEVKHLGDEKLPRQGGPPQANKDRDLHDLVGAQDEMVGPHHLANEEAQC